MIDPKSSSSWNEARFILVQFSFLKWIEALVNLTGIYAFAPLISGVTTTLLLWTPCLRHIHWAINLISSAVDTEAFSYLVRSQWRSDQLVEYSALLGGKRTHNSALHMRITEENFTSLTVLDTLLSLSLSQKLNLSIHVPKRELYKNYEVHNREEREIFAEGEARNSCLQKRRGDV